MNEKSNRILPPDQDQRNSIRDELELNLLVEAAAGTGKTTSLITRMTELLGQGQCTIDTLAAVTFTRKAAAEMRTRFQIELERRAREESEPARQRFVEALGRIERCFIGTIHSFCARLLRERPVEAGVDLSFREIDDAEDALFRQSAWEETIARLYARDDPILDELSELGLETGALQTTFDRLSQFPDVTDWPAPPLSLPDLQPVIGELLEYTRHIRTLLPTLPNDPGTDPLIPKYKALSRLVRYADLSRPAEFFDLLEACKALKKVTQKIWPGGKEQALEELARWNEFCGRIVPLIKIWYARRYRLVLQTVRPAIECYERRKQEAGCLNFQDLLMKTAQLLRRHPPVRTYFQQRVTHLLVDEFQDTDPIQAELMLLLTSDDAEQTDWRKCRPRPGSLFVVGDPKQSIYRFRRADIVTYNQVKATIEKTGGRVIQLSANFRTDAPIIDWVNRVFASEFPERANAYSPVYIPLQPRCVSENDDGVDKISILTIPDDESKKNEICIEYESDFIARFIKKEIDENEAEPGDFFIVTNKKKNLSVYADRLEAYGIPHQVTGGDTLNQIPELKSFTLMLSAVAQPDNPMALVGLLRSELFGVSDPELFALKDVGGEFSFLKPVPKYGERERFESIFSTLRRYSKWLNALPPVSALERIADDLGLFAYASASEGSAVRCGSLAKALELLRSSKHEFFTLNDVVKFFERLIGQDESFDGIPASPPQRSGVRIMNLHQVKGLEAKTVFLADPTGKYEHEPDLHVDRSTDQTAGYCPVSQPGAFPRQKTILAQPMKWNEYLVEEAQFQNTEQLRLFYVAATRAKNRLIVTQRKKNSTRNPWQFFQPSLSGFPCLEDPGLPALPIVESDSIDETFDSKAVDAIPEAWNTIRRPTFERWGVKQLALGGGEKRASGREHGTEWGETIHELLKIMLENPGADLDSLAENLLSEYALDPGLAESAVRTVRAVMASDLWRRATSSTSCLAEIPFQTMWETGGSPAILGGIIDLVFHEPNGWVIADYKTDAGAKSDPDVLAEKYRPQVELYARAWQQITGEPVAETGLFFTETGQYFVL